MGTPFFLLAIAGFIALSLSFPILVSYLIDRRLHEGVDWFARRRVLARGTPAEATVLSSTLLVGRSTGNKSRGAYSVVYDVRPAGSAPFRAKAIEVMFFSEARANLQEGQSVRVRFDAASRVIVLERVDPARVLRDREDARRAKEDALLRGQ